jgi:hypothetical protein
MEEVDFPQPVLPCIIANNRMKSSVRPVALLLLSFMLGMGHLPGWLHVFHGSQTAVFVGGVSQERCTCCARCGAKRSFPRAGDETILRLKAGNDQGHPETCVLCQLLSAPTGVQVHGGWTLLQWAQQYEYANSPGVRVTAIVFEGARSRAPPIVNG